MLSLCSFCVWGQTNSAVSETIEMADLMRSSGKIYVVVLIVALIFAGILIYVFKMDKKVSKLEKEMKALEKEEVTKN